VSVGLTILEYMFDYKRVSLRPAPQPALQPAPRSTRPELRAAELREQRPTTRSRIQELQQRVQRMQGPAVSRTLESLPGMSGVIQLRTGEAYAVDSPSLATALVAGPSQAGEWIAFVGIPDLGFEAAAQFGIELERTVVVPHPGELWLSVTAGLLDVATVVVVKPPVSVGAQQAERLKSRLRMKDAALVCWGEWPRSDATLTITESSWLGLGCGHGRLTARRVVVSVRQGGPVRHVSLWLPGVDQQIAERDHEVIPLSVAQAG
jgi:hypothetical protein